jgi:GMP synthase (glutamine-hydrolysing)
MRPPHIMVIDPAARTPELDCFNRMAAEAPLPLTYHLPGLHGTASLAHDQVSTRGIVILGSATSVHDNLPWQQRLAEWLLPKLRLGIPTLGLCFGHQLVAHMFGGRVGYLRTDRSKRIGFEPTRLEATRLWGDTARTGPLYYSHREVVTTCPEGFTTIASRSDVALDGIQHATLPIWCLQAHPEATSLFGDGITSTPTQFAFGHDLVRRFLAFAAKSPARI